MAGPENNYSRLNRKKGPSRTNSIMNILIAIVVILIVITASIIFLGGDGENKADEKGSPSTEETKDEESNDEGTDESNPTDDDSTSTDNDNQEEDTSSADGELTVEEEDPEKDEESGVETREPSDDEVVAETIINSGWKPIGTTQTGEHVSVYKKGTVDWQEKQEAISYATGLPVDSMTYWMIKNGGSPQKSIGIVSSKDKTEKYRVYLEWVDEQGWQPTKVDVLTTLDFNY